MRITLNSERFKKAAEEVAMEAGVLMQTLMTWQEGLFIRGIILGAYSNPALSNSQQKKLGEAAVEKDIVKVFAPIKKKYTIWEETVEGVKSMAVKTETGGLFSVPKENFLASPSMQEMEKIHFSMRNRAGHVRVTEETAPKSGKWIVKPQRYVPEKALKQYIRLIKSHVGKAKSSWLMAYRECQRKVSDLLPWNPPSWIARHEAWGRSHGGFQTSFNPKDMTGYWSAESELDWGTNPKSVIEFERQKRYKDINGKYIMTRLQGLLDKHRGQGAEKAAA